MRRRTVIGGLPLGIMGYAGLAGSGGAAARRSPGVRGAVFNRAPLAAQPFVPLPLGSIRARGWLAVQLRTMASGLTGDLDRYYPVVGPDNAWLGGTGDAWERGPYWIDGLVPLAHLLDDPALKAKARPWIDHAIKSQLPSGYFGPPDDKGTAPNDHGVQRNNSADWWPRMVMLKVLQQHHELTGDPRVLRLMRSYFAYQLRELPKKPLSHWTQWARHRGGDNLASVLWLYNRTGDRSLLTLARLLTAQTSDWTAGFRAEQPPSAHGVNVAMGVKQPAVAYLVDGDAGRLQALRHGLAFLERDHGQVTGMFSGDEPLHGTNPIQGTELCTIVEFMFSLQIAGQISGDAAMFDRLERITYNALPTQVTDDYMARQYFQQPNQVMISRDVEQYAQQHGGTSQLIGLLDGYPCCTVNMHQGWPKFVNSLWAASSDGGLAALAYGPSVARVEIDGVSVEAEQEGAYPFEDGVRITLKLNRPHRFPLHLRVPGWAAGATIRVGGSEPQPAVAGGFVRLDRTWRDGDRIEMSLPAQVKRSSWHKRLMSLERGPLVFALAVDGREREVGRRAGVPSLEVDPVSPWNYALDPDAAVKVERGSPASDRPWTLAAAPISLSTTGRKVPDWTRYHQTHGSLPFSPVATGEPSETLRLVPYGSTTLRMSEFPVVVKKSKNPSTA